MKPIIGINCDYEEEGKQPYSFTNRDYSEAVIAAGGIPFLLPVIKDKNDVKFLLKKIRYMHDISIRLCSILIRSG